MPLLIPREALDSALTEAQAAEAFRPHQLFNLNALYAQVVVTMFFTGMYFMMFTRYWANTSTSNDPWWTKGAVVSVTFTLSVSCGFMLYDMHYLLIANWGSYHQFLETDKTGWYPILAVSTSMVTQSFFAHRAFRLTGRNWCILCTLGMLILTSVGSTISISVIFYRAPSQLHAPSVLIPELLWLAAAMTADLIITVSIMYGLWKSRTGWDHTDRVILRLIRMTLESQVPPLSVAVIWLIGFPINSSSFLAFTVTGIQPYLYAIGLIYSLNARIKWKQGQSVTMINSAHLWSQRQTDAIMVDVETETYETRLDRPPHATGVNRRHESMEKIQETIDDHIGQEETNDPNRYADIEMEWTEDDKTEAYGSIKSTTFNKSTPRSTTPTATVAV